MTDTTSQSAARPDNRKLTSLFEIVGSVLAMIYAMSIALNIGAELLGFSLLLVSSALFQGGRLWIGVGPSSCFKHSMQLRQSLGLSAWYDGKP